MASKRALESDDESDSDASSEASAEQGFMLSDEQLYKLQKQVRKYFRTSTDMRFMRI